MRSPCIGLADPAKGFQHGQKGLYRIVRQIFSMPRCGPPRGSFRFAHHFIPTKEAPIIYESHVGMAGEEPRVHTFNEFRYEMLPRIKAAGYNTIQLMAIPEHPYYGSFGYHVSSFFAPSSRFGTPEELKHLIDEAHSLGMSVVMDLVHSHAVKNVNEGLGLYDGTRTQFFHEGAWRAPGLGFILFQLFQK